MTKTEAIENIAAAGITDINNGTFCAYASAAGISAKQDRKWLAEDVAEKIAGANTAADTDTTDTFDRTPGAHAGRIETGTAQYWDDDADERDYR